MKVRLSQKKREYETLKKLEAAMSLFSGVDNQFTGAFPRYSGAISAVTGGPPEDINEMPATEDTATEGPIYDGSQLKA